MLRYHAQLNRPYSVAEVRKNMVMYLKNQGGYKINYFKGMKYEDIRPIFEKVWDQIQSFAPMDSKKEKDSEKKGSRKKSLARKRAGEKQSEESTKRQKIEDDVEKEELKAYLDLVPREEFAMEIESLATKYPIVDWKTHVLIENFMYYQIFRADGSSKNYKIFSEMLDDFDRHDVLDLHRLVKARYMTSSPEGYDLMLWGDLKILFEPDEEDEVWRNQHEYNLISWRLFDSYGIHMLLMNNEISIHMMIKKKYPLIQEMLSKMLSRKLKVDHENDMTTELLRVMSSPNHPTSDIEDAFSSNFPDYIPASPNYVPASLGKTYSSSSNNSFGLVPIASPTLSLFHDDPYMKVMHAYYAKESPILPPTIVPPSSMLSPMFNPQEFFLPEELLPLKKRGHDRSSSSTSALPQAFEIGESSRKTSLERHEEQIEEILNHLDELSLDRIVSPWTTRTVKSLLTRIGIISPNRHIYSLALPQLVLRSRNLISSDISGQIVVKNLLRKPVNRKSQ
ncbi:hypothetical protein Tco_1078348 [Tanacetum coccineum]|uniref:Uncharacterized protein n=1 Tax=Tanacetum coccineum TaxID=301880 RepID=A0ABQ5HNU7_9ASTR